MSLHPPLPSPEEPEPQPTGKASVDDASLLTPEELRALREFFALLNEWDHKDKIT